MPPLGDVMSQISGVPRAEVDALFQQVKENHRRLADCSGHTFTDTTPDKPIGKKYRCSHCLGEIDSQAYYWFTKGVEQGGRR